MYKEGFYIRESLGNNAFDYDLRQNKQIFVTNLIDGSLEDLEIGDYTVFEVIENGNIKSFKGLKYFIKTKIGESTTYIFDNHNHAFFFWNKAFFDNEIGLKNTLIHIDEHQDLRIPEKDIDIDLSCDLNNQNIQNTIFEYTNYTLNVGNYIIPAQKIGLIDDIISITGEHDLLEKANLYKNYKDYILNIDIDFFSPGMNYISYDLKKKFILNYISNAKIITIATSPYFIDQKDAINTILDIFK